MDITNKLLCSKNISRNLLIRQRLAVKMARQILLEYPDRAKTIGGKWSIYRKLRGVMLADEVGMGKTYEALALASFLYLRTTKSRRNKFRVLILAAPAIQSKWQWCSEQKSALKDCSNICPPDCLRRDKKNNKQCSAESGPEDYDIGNFLKYLKVGKRQPDVVRLFSTLAQNKIKSKRDWMGRKIRENQQAVFMAGLQTFEKPKGKNNNIHFPKSHGTLYLKENYFDLIIADEAHIARTGKEDETDGQESKIALRKIKALLNHHPKAKLILLTATPFQNHVGELCRLLELLEYGSPEHGSDNGESVIKIITDGLKKSKKDYDEQVNDLKNTDSDFHKFYKDFYIQSDLDIDDDPKTNKRPEQLKDKRKRRLEGLDDYLRDVIIRNRKDQVENKLEEVNIIDDAPAAALQYLLLRDFINPQDPEADNKARTNPPMFLSELVSSEEALLKSLSKKNSSNAADFKAKVKCCKETGKSLCELKKQRLLMLLNKVENEKKRKKKPVVTIFCYYEKTIEMLENFLDKKFCVCVFTGKNPKLKNRTKRLECIRGKAKIAEKTKKIFVLLVSQVGNEGLDFDDFSNTVIHYDGHFNPAVIDQRNGRVYRNETKKEDIKSYRLQLSDTYDERITNIEMEKRKLKDFYLGDKSLEKLLDLTAKGSNGQTKKAIREIWKNFTIDLRPKESLLLKNSAAIKSSKRVARTAIKCKLPKCYGFTMIP